MFVLSLRLFDHQVLTTSYLHQVFSISLGFSRFRTSKLLEFKEFNKTIIPFALVGYSKHPHIRTLIPGFRLIVFSFRACLVRNQPESVLKMFLQLVSQIL